LAQLAEAIGRPLAGRHRPCRGSSRWPPRKPRVPPPTSACPTRRVRPVVVTLDRKFLPCKRW